jgi:hypothetical protein
MFGTDAGMRFPRYRSSIPTKANERVIEWYPGGARKNAEYRMNRKLVGVRFFHESGEPEFEYGIKDGKRHGMEYRWDTPGRLLSAEPWVNGLQHGTSRRWDDDGRLIGTYRLQRGTGIDLWRDRREDGTVYLAEAIYYKDGRPSGFEWWIDECQRSVYIERHWYAGEFHGIYREWNQGGRLHRGFPKYHARGEAVSKRRYLKLAAVDPTLPRFKMQDNAPRRKFPSEIARHLSY